MTTSENESDKKKQLEELRDAEEVSKQRAEEKSRAALEVRFNGGDEEQQPLKPVPKQQSEKDK